MGALTIKCDVCGKEITGMSQKHAERLLRVHKYVKHEQKAELKLSDQEKELLSLFQKSDEGVKKKVLEVLKRERFTFKYVFSREEFVQIFKKFKDSGKFKSISVLISLLLWVWFKGVIDFKKNEKGNWVYYFPKK
jgi:hypothetical protein